MFPCVWPCEPDPEELCAFTDVYGPLRLLLSFQVQTKVLNCLSDVVNAQKQALRDVLSSLLHCTDERCKSP